MPEILKTTIKLEPPGAHSGFDAPTALRERDHLNRWPFAQEIFGISTTGPTNWSVRVGIYGEWGTGKTSVLEFVEGMAKMSGHVAVRFNPWEYSDSRVLWHAFVVKLEAELKQHAPTWKPYSWRQLKKPAWGITNFFAGRGEKIKAATDDQRVTLPLLGLDLLKDFCAYTRNDLQNLLNSAYGKRVLILIDDLDRTSATVVPEILFALKEVMDIPGVAFVCAFDPKVVGEVLQARHPGFGDGIKFLEKIIDYPRWLPVPTADGLFNLALADAKQSCPYVPDAALKDAVPLLPENPRAIRQFIRMLTLLKPQIERHYPHELRWSSILAANVLKVRHPRLAHPLLTDSAFWKSIQMAGLLGSDKTEDLSQVIKEHVEKVMTSEGIEMASKERTQIVEAMKSLCSQINMWSGFDAQSLGYQMNLAEAPHAVTWKEFDSLLAVWWEEPLVAIANEWISKHEAKVGRGYEDVYKEVFDAALNRYTQTLQNAENMMVEADRPLEFSKAESVLALLECLVSKLGRLEEPAKRLDAARFGELLERFGSLVSRGSSIYQSLREREAALVKSVVLMWAPDLAPLVKVLQPFSLSLLRDFNSSSARVLHRQLCDEALSRFAHQVIGRFCEEDFIRRALHNRDESYEIVQILVSPNGVLWKGARKDVLELFCRETLNPAVRGNVFELFHWMNHELESADQFENAQALKELLKDAEIVTTLWQTLVSIPLGPRPIVWLKNLPDRLASLGSPVVIPSWWSETLTSLELDKVAVASESKKS